MSGKMERLIFCAETQNPQSKNTHPTHLFLFDNKERNSDHSNLVYERLTKYHLYIYTIYKIAMENKLNEISVLSMKSRSWRSPSMKCRFKIETDALK